MEFSLTLFYNSVNYIFQVVQVSAPKELAKSHEWFKLSGGDKVVILQSNRPLPQARGLKKMPVTWKVIEGQIKYPKALEKVTLLIEKHFEARRN